MLAALATCTWADEPVKCGLAASTNTNSSVTVTNTIEAASNAPTVETNSVSISVIQPARSISGVTNRPLLDDLSSTASITLVIQKKSEAGTFSRQAGNGSFGFANIEAGFGQAYDSDSIVLRGRNGTAWEETRYVFFKKIVKF